MTSNAVCKWTFEVMHPNKDASAVVHIYSLEDQRQQTNLFLLVDNNNDRVHMIILTEKYFTILLIHICTTSKSYLQFKRGRRLILQPVGLGTLQPRSE